jgi:hypothetical protein
VTTTTQENQPSLVSMTKHGGETLYRVESSKWTERMLAALDRVSKQVNGRWPNAFFAEHGLYSLLLTHAAERQSPSG